MYKITEAIPPEYPSWDRIEKLKAAGFDTDGHIDQLKAIIKDNGFNLPTEHEGLYGFLFTPPEQNKTYTRLYINRVDAMAEEILMLHKFKMI